jgi:hypothetical protein
MSLRTELMRADGEILEADRITKPRQELKINSTNTPQKNSILGGKQSVLSQLLKLQWLSAATLKDAKEAHKDKRIRYSNPGF